MCAEVYVGHFWCSALLGDSEEFRVTIEHDDKFLSSNLRISLTLTKLFSTKLGSIVLRFPVVGVAVTGVIFSGRSIRVQFVSRIMGNSGK